MKTTITKIFFTLMLLGIGMFVFTAANAQSGCTGNKVLMSIGSQGCGCHCKKKCVAPADVQAYLNNGWRYGACVGSCCWLRESGNSSSPETALTEIFPNPVSNSATITFFLSQTEKVSLKIFDKEGRLVTNLSDKVFEAGENEMEWSTENVNSGIYFLQFQSENNQERKKIIVTK